MGMMDGIKSFMRPSGLDMQDDDFDDEFDDFDDEFDEDEERSGGFFGGLFSRKKSEDEFDLDDYEEDEEPEKPAKKDVSFRGYTPSYKASDRSESRTYENSSSAKAAPKGTAVKRQPQESTNTRTGGARVIPMSKTVGSSSSATKISSELYMIKPRSEEDARVAVDELLNGKVVIVNLEGLNIEIAQYVTDFVTGANYSIGGNFSTINNQVLVFAPANVNMTGAFDEGSGDSFNF